MRLNKYTLYVEGYDNRETVEDALNTIFDSEKNDTHYEFKVIEDKEEKGLYINVLRPETVPAFKFRDSMDTNIGKLRKVLNNRTVLTYNNSYQDPQGIDMISDHFAQFIKDNAGFYYKD